MLQAFLVVISKPKNIKIKFFFSILFNFAKSKSFYIKGEKLKHISFYNMLCTKLPSTLSGFLKVCTTIDWEKSREPCCMERSYIEHCLRENNNNPAKTFFLFGFQFQTINVVFHNSKEWRYQEKKRICSWFYWKEEVFFSWRRKSSKPNFSWPEILVFQY